MFVGSGRGGVGVFVLYMWDVRDKTWVHAYKEGFLSHPMSREIFILKINSMMSFMKSYNELHFDISHDFALISTIM